MNKGPVDAPQGLFEDYFPSQVLYFVLARQKSHAILSQKGYKKVLTFG